MTNENAIRWLKDLLKSDLPMEQYETAIKKGIEALKPGGDLISREETLTAFADYVGSGMSMNDYDALWNIVAKMPSVKQEPKIGHWIVQPSNEEQGERPFIWWKCSECGHVIYSESTHDRLEFHAFCSRCGAKMIEPQESEDKE